MTQQFLATRFNVCIPAKTLAVTLWAFLHTGLMTGVASAQDLFPAGVEAKASGMESAIAAKSAPATLYNPANLGLEPARKRAYLEAGAIRARMTYEHPQYDQVYVEVQSPVATMGLTGAFFDQRLRAGLAIFPTKSGGIEINGIPQPIGQETHSLAVENNDRAIKTGLGASWAVNPAIHLGAGIIHAIEDRSLSARVVGSANNVLTQSLKNDFTRGIFGVRADSKAGSVAAAITTSVRKTYEGESRIAGSTTGSKPQTVAWDPTVIATGWSLAMGPVRTDFSLNHRMWGEASGIMREEISSSPSGADIHDVTETGLTLTWTIHPNLAVSGSLANLPSPWGEGGVRTGTASLMGPAFGQANGIDRHALGLLAHSSGTRFGTFDVGLLNIWGNRTISSSGANPGHYQIDVLTVTAASTYVF